MHNLQDNIARLLGRTKYWQLAKALQCFILKVTWQRINRKATKKKRDKIMSINIEKKNAKSEAYTGER